MKKKTENTKQRIGAGATAQAICTIKYTSYEQMRMFKEPWVTMAVEESESTVRGAKLGHKLQREK